MLPSPLSGVQANPLGLLDRVMCCPKAFHISCNKVLLKTGGKKKKKIREEQRITCARSAVSSLEVTVILTGLESFCFLQRELISGTLFDEHSDPSQTIQTDAFATETS